MITLFMVDNYKCFTNFEWRPGRLALMLGENGAGKTTLGEALWCLVGLLSYREEVRNLFPSTTLTRWDARPTQVFGFDVVLSAGEYKYRLVIQHDLQGKQKPKIIEETLDLGERKLLRFVEGEICVFRDDGSPGQTIKAEARRSGVGAFGAGPNSALGAFKEWVESEIWLLRPDPRAMTERTDEELEGLEVNMSNLASWYPPWAPTDPTAMLALMTSLRPVLPGFTSLQVMKNAPILQVAFSPQGQRSFAADFDELSDGQRQLVALYLIRHAIATPGRLVIIDEPDNYVGIREIQPWLGEMVSLALTADGPQIWLMSHHPEVLNQLAGDYGHQFVRPHGGPVRVEPFPDPAPLTAAELAAGGWDHE